MKNNGKVFLIYEGYPELVLSSCFLEKFFTDATRVKPFDEISTNVFLEVVEKCLGYVTYHMCLRSPFSNFDSCPEILTNFGKNLSKIGLSLNLASKVKKNDFYLDNHVNSVSNHEKHKQV